MFIVPFPQQLSCGKNQPEHLPTDEGELLYIIVLFSFIEDGRHVNICREMDRSEDHHAK